MVTACHSLDLRIWAKNGRINTRERLEILLCELDQVVWDIILFSETHASRDSLVLDGGHHLYLDLAAHFASGVGVLIHARWIQYVRKYTGSVIV